MGSFEGVLDQFLGHIEPTGEHDREPHKRRVLAAVHILERGGEVCRLRRCAQLLLAHTTHTRQGHR